MGELLGALGLAWPRLLLYPGGLFALGAAWLLGRWLARCGLAPGGGWHGAGGAGMLPALLGAVPPLAAISLLPLAPARPFPYGLDLVAALALLEAPRLWRAAGDADASGAIGRAALARAYLPLLVAAAALAEAAGGLELTRLLRLPEGWPGRALLGLGAALWLAALPPLLADGPAGLVGRLRALGLLAVAALPLLAALAAAGLLPAEYAGWALPPAALLLAGLGLGAAARLPWRAHAVVGLGAAALALIALDALAPGA